MGNTNGTMEARRWQQVRAERDDLPLFSADRKVFTTDSVTLRCCGCPTTATEVRHKGLMIPAGWVACGETAGGAIALWCAQCWHEGRCRQAKSTRGE
jgi:hypothetical protein